MSNNPLDVQLADAPITSVARMREAIARLEGQRDTWSVWAWTSGRIDHSPPAVFLQQTQVKNDATGGVLAVFGPIYTQRMEQKRYASFEAIVSDLEKASDYLPVRLNIGCVTWDGPIELED
jgi:hypothetical protein